MVPSPTPRQGRAHAPGAQLVLLAALFITIGLIEVALLWHGTATLWLSLSLPVLAWCYAGAGLVAWWRRPSNRFGFWLCVAALSWLASGLTNSTIAPLTAVGLIFATAPLAVCTHLFHAFPSGRLRGGSIPIVIVGYVVCLVLQAPLYLFTDAASPADVLQIRAAPRIVEIAGWVQTITGTGVMAATTVVLVNRLRRADGLQRRVLGPVWAYGAFAVLMVPAAPNVLGPALGLSDLSVEALQGVVLAGIPLAFALGLLRGGFARTGQVEELGAWLAAGPGTRPALRDLLADAVGDPELAFWFWSPESETYVDADGSRIDPHTRPSRAAVHEVSLGGSKVGAMIYDPTLVEDEEVVDRASHVAALALERERLVAELLLTRHELRSTLTRVVAGEDRERRRIARDLHDGLQSRLILLGVDAFRIESDPTASESVRQTADRLRNGLEASTQDLRRLVHGVMPPALVERGLYGAVSDLLASVPITTDVDLAGSESALPSAVEYAAYLAVSEAITNTLKYAEATHVRVRLHYAGNALRLTVTDNGTGGAYRHGTGGLAGLADRFAALGGRFELDSPPGGGTTLTLEAPC